MSTALATTCSSTVAVSRRTRCRDSLTARIAVLARENADLRRKLEEHQDLWDQAHIDSLTGLWNRRHADARLREELSRGARQAGYRFSVVAIDVNDLKPINDLLGHAAGDAVLARVAGFLRASVRAHDVCCRVGGDEFIIILPDCDSVACAAFVDRLRAGDRAPSGPGVGRIGVSVGAACFPADGRTAEILVRVADTDMYADKRAGKRGRRSDPRLAEPAVATA